MTIRERLQFRYRLMAASALMILASSSLWLHSTTPLNHSFRANAVTIAEFTVTGGFFVVFRCSQCRRGLTAVSRQVLFGKQFVVCPHCGAKLDQFS
jgi:DNA-directed RNA polymerase subunit RPC12/RpoP